jgi:hypothetical protein
MNVNKNPDLVDVETSDNNLGMKTIETILEEFNNHPALSRLTALELLAITTGRANQWNGETITDWLRTTLNELWSEAYNTGAREQREVIKEITDQIVWLASKI